MADFKVVGETMLDPSGFATGVAGMAKTGAKVIGAGVAAMSAAIGGPITIEIAVVAALVAGFVYLLSLIHI